LYGPRCNVMMRAATKTQKEAREYCELQLPGRVIESNPGPKTMCLVEATTRCRKGFVLVLGMCYYFDKTKEWEYSYGGAECERIFSTVATLPHTYAVGVWEQRFAKIGQVWIQITEAHESLVKNISAGDKPRAVALAFSGQHFEFIVAPNSLVRIDKEYKLQILCEYKPELTLAELRYLGDRFSEMYYPVLMMESGFMTRSSSHYNRPNENTYNAMCHNVLKAFGTTQKVEFHPDNDTLRDMAGHKSISFARTPGVSVLDLRKMNTKNCVLDSDRFEVDNLREDYENYNIQFREKQNIVCDNMRSVAVVHPRKTGETPILRVMSDSQRAPVWCKLGFTPHLQYVADPGYFLVPDMYNTMYQHRFFGQAMTWDKAEGYCVREGGHLSGFNSFKVMNLLLSKMPDYNDKNTPEHQQAAWLGAKKNPKCVKRIGFSDNKNDPCYRSKTMLWQNNVATTEITNSMWLDAPNIQNPDNAGKNQHCLVLHSNRNVNWAAKNGQGNLDDNTCTRALDTSAMIVFFSFLKEINSFY
uniref:C-type lectin domain-containing protein n=1 Tax=Caenorhabditis japonica TaxID=281687 RepID=A0A8R1DY41_CAEJA